MLDELVDKAMKQQDNKPAMHNRIDGKKLLGLTSVAERQAAAASMTKIGDTRTPDGVPLSAVMALEFRVPLNHQVLHFSHLYSPSQNYANSYYSFHYEVTFMSLLDCIAIVVDDAQTI